jgi:hypothetical protein
VAPSLRREDPQAIMPQVRCRPRQACVHRGKGTDGPAGNSGCGWAANVGTPRGGEARPEGCDAWTGGRRPASVREYSGVPWYGGAARAGAPGALAGATSRHGVTLFQPALFESKILQNLQLKCTKC